MANQIERVEKALTKLVLEQPFFATLALKLNLVEKDVGTFATDGKNLYIDPEWCAELSKDEIVTVLAHEVLHCALGHLWRAPQSSNMEVWNVAIDNEANWELEEFNKKEEYRGKSTPFPFPKCGRMLEDRFRGQAAEKIYRTLIEEYQDKKDKGKNGKGGTKVGIGDIIPAPQNQKEEMKEQWERAVIQAAMATKDRGNLPGSIEELVKKLTSSAVDWRTILRDCLSVVAHEDWSWRKANPRYTDNDFILPSLYNDKIGSIVFAIDTSGSITQKMLAQFISEAQFALDELSPEFLEVIYCDTEIHAVDRYEPGDTVKEKVIGRGGTDFRPVFEHCNKMEDAPKIVVYMTDLYGEFPDTTPEYPVIWITNSDQKVPFGEVIKVDI